MGVLPERKVRWQRWALALTVAGIAVAPAREVSAASRSVAKAPECPSAGTRVVGFARAVDGEVFVTADGEEVRLAGILPLGAGGEAASPDAASAKDALNRALRDRTVTLAPAQTPRDRYGRSLAHVFADGVWVQGALLRDGEVRAAPDLASAPCANALLGAEAEAREGRFKHWRDGRFRVRGPNDLGNREGSFQIVEGEVVTATVNRARAFINFGADYRTDFTVTIDPEDMRAFRQARFDVGSLAGKRIRVRGWVEFYNGPEMTITTPAAIEVLE